jgi:hypothetical protein
MLIVTLLHISAFMQPLAKLFLGQAHGSWGVRTFLRSEVKSCPAPLVEEMLAANI